MKHHSTEIEDLLPHRTPFLFVKEVKLGSPEEAPILAKAVFPQDWPVFQGHFPQFPVVPGVILVETLAQAGGAGLRLLKQEQGESLQHSQPATDLFLLSNIHQARFKNPVLPDFSLDLHISNLRLGSVLVVQKGEIFHQGTLMCHAEWSLIRLNSQDIQKDH